MHCFLFNKILFEFYEYALCFITLQTNFWELEIVLQSTCYTLYSFSYLIITHFFHFISLVSYCRRLILLFEHVIYLYEHDGFDVFSEPNNLCFFKSTTIYISAQIEVRLPIDQRNAMF